MFLFLRTAELFVAALAGAAEGAEGRLEAGFVRAGLQVTEGFAIGSTSGFKACLVGPDFGLGEGFKGFALLGVFTPPAVPAGTGSFGLAESIGHDGGVVGLASPLIIGTMTPIAPPLAFMQA